MSSSTQMVSTSTSTAVLTPAQLITMTESIEKIITGKSLTTVLAQLPAACISLYQQVVAVYNSSAANQQAVVIQLLEQTVGTVSGLQGVELVGINQVIEMLVPALLSYLPKIEAGIVSGFIEVEDEAESCCSLLRAKLC